MTKRFIPVLAACLFLMVGTAQAATSLAFPPPDTKGGKPLMQTLSGRATNRSFTAKPLSDKLLGDLLWAAYGVNRPNGKRTIPTAQNRQDLEIYATEHGSTTPRNTASNRSAPPTCATSSPGRALSAKPR